jgi:hypothetical protein
MAGGGGAGASVGGVFDVALDMIGTFASGTTRPPGSAGIVRNGVLGG